jgi:hypothetical protein
MTNPHNLISIRLAERLGLDPVDIMGDGETPPRIQVETALPGAGWRHTIMHRWNSPRMAMIEVSLDGTVTYLGDPPETWEPPITISSAELVAALNDAAADLERLMDGQQ